MTTQSFRVGELARRTGVSVRTLHHYDRLGLLSPARRSGARHRLYGEADVVRLLRIRALVQLGFKLADVRALMARRECAVERVLELQVERLRDQAERAQRLCRRLESLLAAVRGRGAIPIGEFLSTIEAMTMFERHYDEDQLRRLQQRGAQLGPEQLEAVQAEWPQLIERVRAAMQRGDDPRGPAVRELAERWRELVAMFTGGDESIRRSAAAAMRDEPRIREQFGLDAALLDYVGRALTP